jgi:hypothetical protein
MHFKKPFNSFITSFSKELSTLDRWKLCLKDPAFILLWFINIVLWVDIINNL